MYFLHEILDSLMYLALIGLGLAPLEYAFRAHTQRFFRPAWWTDFFFFFGGNLLWTKITLLVLGWVRTQLDLESLHALRATARSLWLPVQIMLVVFCSDVCIYWAHRLSHKYDWLWRFHKVHHTAEHLDWLAAFREHPIDNIYTRVIVNLPALLLGFPLEIIGGFVLFRGLWGNFIHSNTAFGLGPFKYLLGSPRLHHWHHDFERNSSCNFANLMPLMDVLFGTFYDPGRMPDRYGIDDPMPRGYISQLIYPMVPERWMAGVVAILSRRKKLQAATR
ncbi:MAG: sterol desaturase family protein [Leptospiraceae bacterium]|nr:sterol desaturase family protein [Leptospiraceae bacterium]MCB1320210.1 sterol desaturase family protein [Leptospiraceae bacterium]